MLFTMQGMKFVKEEMGGNVRVLILPLMAVCARVACGLLGAATWRGTRHSPIELDCVRHVML